MTVRKILLMALVAVIASHAALHAKPIRAKVAQKPTTFCNPLNLNYRFMKIKEGAGIREAADPVVMTFKGRHYLFASMSSGYWVSSDFSNWQHVLVPDSVLPVEVYAPGVYEHRGCLHYMCSTRDTAMIYRSAAPETGQWEPVKTIKSDWDPAFLVSGDSLFVYYGSSPDNPIGMRTYNIDTLDEIDSARVCFNSNKEQYGWERPGPANDFSRRPYLEGAWMTRHNNRYYLQYAAPGTEYNTYADGVYVSDSPHGPFSYMPNSPVSHRLGGFIGGAGHGCLFCAPDGSYWKAATNAVSVRHPFERRLSFYPSYFDADGYLYADTYLGDYPMFLPGTGSGSDGGSGPGWMLLSCGKPVEASSSLQGYEPANAVDEEVRTAWVAAGNGSDQWLSVDLQRSMDVHAIQVNFDEYGARQHGYAGGVYERYILSASLNGKKWYTVADRSDKTTDQPHDYIEFEQPFKARYIRFENRGYTVSDNVSLRELRVFGRGGGICPASPNFLSVIRNPEDRCKADLSWDAVDDAQGYVVRYGIDPDKLYGSVQVTGGRTSLSLGCLNADTVYYFTVDAYNENGVIPNAHILECD